MTSSVGEATYQRKRLLLPLGALKLSRSRTARSLNGFAVATSTDLLRACPKIPRGPVFAPKAGWRGATKENILPGSSTEEQRSQAAFG
ncbi:MAG: hypothetical protein FJ398_21335, partial [Verrucomicrobia bacterium]|nr:hypothetical protein [Verrucomicrobiota bacterium]